MVDGTCDQFFSRTALAVDQDGRIGFRYPQDLCHHLFQSCVLADHVTSFFPQCLFQGGDFTFHAAVFDGTFDDE